MTPAQGQALLIEGFVQKWLQESRLGREIMTELGMSLDQAVSVIIELLNTGHLKIASQGQGQFGIRPCAPPEPPLSRIERSSRVLQ